MASPYRTKQSYASQLESDHKDILISQLKAEAFELRQSDKDYQDLNSRVNNLNHRFHLLQEEKNLDEREYLTRNEHNMKTIHELRAEVDRLKADLAVNDGDIQEVREDNDNVNEIISKKSNEVAKLKCDLADLNDENTNLEAKIKDYKHQIAKTQHENKEATSDSHETDSKVQDAISRAERTERLIKELENNVDRLLRTNDEHKQHQDEVRAQIRDRDAELQDTEDDLSENRKRIIALETRLNDRTRLNEKLNNDIVVSQREQKEELEKSSYQSDRIRNLENAVHDKNGEIDDLRAQIDEVKRQRAHLLEETDNLNNDVRASTKHLDNLTTQNYELVEELDKCVEEDEEIRRYLQRSERISAVTFRYQDKFRSSQVKLSSSLLSPAKHNRNSETPVRTASTKAEN